MERGLKLFDNSGFLQSGVGAVLLDGFDGASRDDQVEGFFEFGNIDLLFLKIWVLSHHPGRVEFSSTGGV